MFFFSFYQTSHRNHHAPALYSPLTRITPVVVSCFCHYCCRCSGALCFVLLGKNIPFTTSLHHPTRFSETSHASTFLLTPPLAYLNHQCTKRTRSLTAAPRPRRGGYGS